MSIGAYLEIFRDDSHSIPPNQIPAQTFSRYHNQTPNFDLSDASYWIHFRVSNQTNNTNTLLQIGYPLLDSAVLYRLAPDGGLEKLRKEGMSLPFTARKYPYVNMLFRLPVAPGATEDFYLKVRSTEQVIVPLSLLPQTALVREYNLRNLFSGGYMGAMLVMILYNIFIFLSTKERSYIYFVIYILFISLSQLMLTGYGLQLLFPQHPGLHKFFVIGFPALAGISAILFIRAFLEAHKNNPRADKLLIAVAVVYGLALILRLLHLDAQSSRLTDIAGLFGAIVVYGFVVPMAMRRSRPAIFLLISWTVFIVGLVLFVMRNFNLLPYNMVTSYTMQAGTAAMVTLLAIAIADKINVLEKERKKAQAVVLRHAQENERLIREQNTMLEHKVSERTAALAKAFNNLKQAQAQLVEQEKMASLGQLTAGIAHEINNPINFVTSNVKPLQRDIDMVLQSFEEVTEMAISGTAVNQPEKIEALKEEMEYDYLKEEIAFLLRGISEGSERTAEIVKGLRIFSRVDESDLKKANVTDGLDSTAIIVNTLLNNRIELRKEYQQIPMIECYPGKLNQVFLNIISNGIYAVSKRWGEQPGGVITLATAMKEDQVEVRIADNGTGMDEQTRKKLFEPFFTTKEVGEGTGLGLPIAYNIIRKHHGTISVNSEPDKGTEFVIVLPILQPTVSTEN